MNPINFETKPSVQFNVNYSDQHKTPMLTRYQLKSINSKRTNSKFRVNCRHRFRCCFNLTNHFLATFFSYSGALILAIAITRNYLDFRTATDLEMKSPLSTELPTVSICFFFKLADLHNNLMSDGYAQSSLTVGQIADLQPTWEDFVYQCLVLDEDYDWVECISLENRITEYISLYSKCFTLFRNLSKPIVYEKTKVGGNFLLNVVLNTSIIKTNTIGMFITHPTEEIDEALGNPSFVQFDSFNFNRATLTYDRVTVYSLPPPYDSMCLDYTRLPCKSQQSCITTCIFERSYADKKILVNRRYVRLQDYLLDARFSNYSDIEYTEECNAKYSEAPCEENMYHAQVTSQFLSPFRNNDTFQISMAYPLTTNTIVIYSPFQSFMDYICYVTSIVGLWTEISMIRVSDKALVTLHILFYIYSRRYATHDDSNKTKPQQHHASNSARNKQQTKVINYNEYHADSPKWTKTQVLLKSFTKHINPSDHDAFHKTVYGTQRIGVKKPKLTSIYSKY